MTVVKFVPYFQLFKVHHFSVFQKKKKKKKKLGTLPLTLTASQKPSYFTYLGHICFIKKKTQKTMCPYFFVLSTATIFHARPYIRFTETRSNHRRKRLHRTNQGSNFPGGSFSNRGNVRTPIQLRRERESQQTHPFHINSTTSY